MDNEIQKLIGVKCEKCGKLYIPPVYICIQCNKTQFKEVELTGKGTVRTYTTIRVPPLGFEEQVPYNVAVIGLEEGVNVTTRIISDSGKELRIGTGVTFAKKEEGVYWFRCGN